MNLRRVFEPSQRTSREDAAKAAAAAERARTAKKSATSEACLSEQELQLVAKVKAAPGKRATVRQINAEGVVTELIDANGNWIGEDNEDETPADRAAKHAELRRVLNELRSN
jgi:hypothetical protein